MRVLKQKDQSFLAGVFGMDGKLFFSAAGLLFFDLDHPQTPLPEKELWQLVKKRIPKPTPFDTGMPKPQAEVLVYGACHPRKRDDNAQEAEEVSLQVGELRKKLYVFGPRHWEQTSSGWKIVHDGPLSKPLPLTWSNAFGGSEFPRNPLGKGAAPLDDGKGGQYHPLPQIEAPDRLIGSLDDQPDPSAMAPIQQTWPQRMEKAGTYDQKWLKEHWPHLPSDFDLRFFNTAPEDQQISSYFQGNEALALEGMHPQLQTLESVLPGLRIRCFATLLDDPNADAEERRSLKNAHFQELKTSLDTIWLFPEDKRAALCFRGTCQIKDDDYRDVANVMLVTEPLDSSEQPLEHYRELRDTWVDRMLQLDKTHLEDGKQRIADAMNRLKDLPGEIQGQLDKGLGKTPYAPTTPAEKFANAGARLDASEALLNKLEQTALGLRAKHGHIVKMDLGHFSAMRQNIAKIRGNLKKTEQEISQGLDEANKARQQARQQLAEQKKALEAKGIQADLDPDDALLPPKEMRWKKAVMQQLGPWRRELLKNASLYNKLLDMGLSEKTIENALLGYNPAPLEVERKLWGLEPDGESTTMTIPPGLVLPQFQDADPVALRIRQGDAPFPPQQTDHLVPGSLPLDKAAMLFAPTEGRLLARVSDQLEGLLLAQLAGDICSAAVMPTPDAPLGETGEKLAKAAPAFVVFVRAADGETAEKQWQTWHKAKPSAQRIPLEHGGLVQARQQGRDIRAMLRQLVPADKAAALPPEPAPPVTAADVKPGMPLPLMDIKKFVSETRSQAKTAVEAKIGPMRQEAEAMRKQAMEQAATQLRKQGLDPEQYLKPVAKSGPPDFKSIQHEVKETLEQAKARLAGQNQLTPEIEEKLDATSSKTMAMLDKAAAVLPASGKVTPPQWARDLRAKHGLDPETGKGLSRDKVAAMLAEGKTNFSGKNLSNLNLSGMNFSGANLADAVCLATDFSRCNLQAANLHKAFCKQADFSHSSLKDANLERCLLHKARLLSADLASTNCQGALFSEADCNQASLQNATLTRAVLLKTKLAQADLSGVRAERAVFNQAELAGCSFAGADLSRAVLMKCPLNGVSFAGLRLGKTAFMGCSGQGIDFTGAAMDNARLLKGCDLPGALFAKASLNKFSAIDCNLAGADFSEAELHKALLQNCDLSKAIFWRARARHARLLLCNLEKANLRGLDLLQGSLRKSRIVAADLSGANCFGVDFYKAVMGDTVLDLADTRRSLLERREHLLPGS